MKIRKYVARNMPEALQQVRDDLGDQAVILNTRQLRGNNRYNPNGEAHVEVTAAYDDAVPSVTPVQAETGVTPAGLAARRYSRTTEGSVAPGTSAASAGRVPGGVSSCAADGRAEQKSNAVFSP